MNAPVQRAAEFDWGERRILGCRVRHAGPAPDDFFDEIERGIARYSGKPMRTTRPAARGRVAAGPAPAAVARPALPSPVDAAPAALPAPVDVAPAAPAPPAPASPAPVSPSRAVAPAAACATGATPRRRRRATALTDPRYRELMLAGAKAAEIAAEMGVTEQNVYVRAHALDLMDAWREARRAAGTFGWLGRHDRAEALVGRRAEGRAAPRGRAPSAPPSEPVTTPVRGQPSVDKAVIKRAGAAERARAAVRDRRRFKQTPVPTGESRSLGPDHAAVVEGRTTFPGRVLDPADPATAGERLLKDGASNSKIGGDVLVGRLKGAKIFTLALEERASCPRSCIHWRTCMGVNDPYAVRWKHGDALIERLRAEVAGLVAAHARVLVRLHYLGDFWSTGYERFWFDQVWKHDGLSVFGFTAHGAGSEIGAAIAASREALGGERYAIRHSNSCYAWGSFTLDLPTAKKTIGEAIVCPEQASAMNGAGDGRHCGSCGACWSCDRPIVFVEH